MFLDRNSFFRNKNNFQGNTVELLEIIHEHEMQLLNVTKSLMIAEHYSIIKEDVNIFLQEEEGSLSKIWESIKAFFSKIWEWIKSFFTKQEGMLSNLVEQSRKAFEYAKSHQKEIIASVAAAGTAFAAVEIATDLNPDGIKRYNAVISGIDTRIKELHEALKKFKNTGGIKINVDEMSTLINKKTINGVEIPSDMDFKTAAKNFITSGDIKKSGAFQMTKDNFTSMLPKFLGFGDKVESTSKELKASTKNIEKRLQVLEKMFKDLETSSSDSKDSAAIIKMAKAGASISSDMAKTCAMYTSVFRETVDKVTGIIKKYMPGGDKTEEKKPEEKTEEKKPEEKTE